MSQLLDNPRVCFVCHEEVTDMRKAGYVSGYGLPIVGHMACMEALAEEIENRKHPVKPVHKATEPLNKQAMIDPLIPGAQRVSNGETVTRQDALDFVKLMAKVWNSESENE